MRQKLAREVIINKYIEFLKDVKCYDIFEHTELSELMAKHQINKTVRKALVDLSIIDLKNDAYWNYLSFEPSRQLALTMLNYILERAKKSRATPIAGLEDNTKAMAILIEKMTHVIEQRRIFNVGDTNKPKTETLFSGIDSKQKDRFEMVKAIASGIFKDWESINDYQAYGHRIITATDHILELLNKH